MLEHHFRETWVFRQVSQPTRTGNLEETPKQNPYDGRLCLERTPKD